MAKLTKTEFCELRNQIYGGLVESKLIEEDAETFQLIENLIDSTNGIDIDWEDETPLFCSVETKDKVEDMLIDLWAKMGIETPSNYEDIVQDCYEDILETADPKNWHSGDVTIAFRRWIEKQTN